MLYKMTIFISKDTNEALKKHYEKTRKILKMQKNIRIKNSHIIVGLFLIFITPGSSHWLLCGLRCHLDLVVLNSALRVANYSPSDVLINLMN